LFTEESDAYWVDITIAKDKKFLIINSSSKIHSEIRVWPLKIVDKSLVLNEIKCIFPRALNSRAFCEHARENFYFLTDLDDVFDLKVITLADSEISEKP